MTFGVLNVQKGGGAGGVIDVGHSHIKKIGFLSLPKIKVFFLLICALFCPKCRGNYLRGKIVCVL